MGTRWLSFQLWQAALRKSISLPVGAQGASMKLGLIIMAKEPMPGRVKTRLCPPYTPEEAAELCRCFLLDTFELAAMLQGVKVTIAYFPAKAGRTLKARVPPAFELMPQRGADLGERLSNAFEELFSLGYERVVAIGADSPTLPPAYLDR
ncbi:MAG TPA: glycosyltransferase, partial [Anaerolineae bacterium]|nr:glycosyltransferase [Anaerolineae bacterium]